MSIDTNKRDQSTKWIRWVARIWSIPIMLIALIFIIGTIWSQITTGAADPYAVEDYPQIEKIPPILMLLSALGLGITWRWERFGSLMVLLLQITTVIVLLVQPLITGDTYQLTTPLLMSLVITIPGILFLVSSYRVDQANQ
jgi:fatty acid desaturase